MCRKRCSRWPRRRAPPSRGHACRPRHDRPPMACIGAEPRPGGCDSGCSLFQDRRVCVGRTGAFAADFEQGGFGDFESHDPGGVEACDLAAEFGADGPGSAGDEDNFALERAADLVLFQVYGVAAEEVFDGDGADLRGEAAGLDDFTKARNGPISHTGLLAALEDCGHLGARGGRHRDENHLDLVGPGDERQIFAGSEDPGALDRVAALVEAVFHKPDHVIGERGILPDVAHQRHARVARAIYEDTLRLAGNYGLGGLVGDPHGQASARGHYGTQQEIQQIERTRETLRGENQNTDAAEGRTKKVANPEAEEIGDGSVTPPSAIQSQKVKHDNFDWPPNAECGNQVRAPLAGNLEIEPQEKGGYSSDEEYPELRCAQHPSAPAGKTAQESDTE